MVEDDDIHLTISTFGANLENATKQLIQLGNDNGGKDNISVVWRRSWIVPRTSGNSRQDAGLVQLHLRLNAHG
jgi:serine/threonine protein phosphatase PrpC